jgi:4-amino-4-deoxy-L-arabinose transferase-like glycosyltransferase
MIAAATRDKPAAALAASARVRARGGLWLDAAALAGLLLLWGLLLAARWDALPLQLWDESRNANNALEVALHGRWLTPTFAGVVDHWNTKPPLLIWCMAALMRLGAPPLLAVRAPSLLAAAACAAGVWAALRFGARDRLAALAGAALLLCAPVFIGVHGAATGDFDAPESAALLGYVLCGWAALETRRFVWVALAAVALTLGVLTKGVAATLALPGLALYALCQPRALGALLRDVRTWAAVAAAAAVAGGYYLAREAVDPGYLAAVAHNELGGRFLHVTEQHQGGPAFYLAQLWTRAQPAAAAALLAILTLVVGRGPRRRLAAACALALASLLGVLSISQSKMEWYAVPMVPLLALLAGLGLSDVAGLAARYGAVAGAVARAAVGLVLACAAVAALAWVRGAPARLFAGETGPQYRYAAFLDALARRGGGEPLFVTDGGLFNAAGFSTYNPMLRFDATLAARRGRALKVVTPDAALPLGAQIATCDAGARATLHDRYVLAPEVRDQGCTLDRVTATVDE